MTYQCFAEGCPANHVSKHEICVVTSNGHLAREYYRKNPVAIGNHAMKILISFGQWLDKRPAVETTGRRPVAWRIRNGMGDWHFTTVRPHPAQITKWEPLYISSPLEPTPSRIPRDIGLRGPDDEGVTAPCEELLPEKASEPRKTRYCDYDLCADTFDPAHSNNDH